MLVATGSFSPERGLPVKFCVDFNHFKSFVMKALLHSKYLNMLISEQLEAALSHATNKHLIYSSYLCEVVI